MFCSVYHLDPDLTVRLDGADLLITTEGTTHQPYRHSLETQC